MIAILGLVILIATMVVGLAGVLTNMGSTHHLAHPFTVLGFHVTGSTGRLFLYGIVVGTLALLGVLLLLSGVRRSARAAQAARRDLKQSRRETAAVSKDRDELLAQRQAAPDDTLDTRLTPYGRTRTGASPTTVEDQAVADRDPPERGPRAPLRGHSRDRSDASVAPIEFRRRCAGRRRASCLG